MKHSNIYAISLIIGTLGTIVTMFFHPTGHDLLGQPDEIARRNELVTVATHTLALISLPILFYGFLGFNRRLGLENPSVLAGLVSYGFGLVAVLSAAVINGLVGPILTRRIIESDETTQKFLHLILLNNGLLNQAFTKVYVVAAAFAFIFWSICLWRKGTLMQITAIIGFIVGLASLFGIFSGHLRLNVHGFGLIILAQSIWTVLVAIFMFRQAEKS